MTLLGIMYREDAPLPPPPPPPPTVRYIKSILSDYFKSMLSDSLNPSPPSDTLSPYCHIMLSLCCQIH